MYGPLLLRVIVMAEVGSRALSVVDRLESRLARAIRDGEWAVGAQLPPLRALAGKYGVSVNSAQAALRRLGERHIVELRPRRGVYVKATPRVAGRVANHIAVVRRVTVLSREILPVEAAGTDGWGLRIVHAMEAGLHKAGFDTTNALYPEDDPAPLEDVLRRLDSLGDAVAAVLCFVSERLAGLLPALDERDIPWLTINALDRTTAHNFVAADNIGGGMRVGRCFGEMGLRRLLILHSGFDHTPSNIEKVEGVFRGMLESGAPTDGVRAIPCRTEHEAGESGAYAVVRAFLEENGPPEAIFATGDLMAAGAMAACRDHGLRAPEDVGVIGATGLAMAEYADPPLTVLAQPMDEMGRLAGEMLTGMARHGISRVVGRRVPSPIVFRESIAVPERLRREFEKEYEREVEASADWLGPLREEYQPVEAC